MSKDIRSFFSPVNKKTNQPVASKQQKKRPLALDSSDDEIVEATPKKEQKPNFKKLSKRPKTSIDSDSDDTSKKPKPKSPKKVNAAEIFGSTPVKQSKIEPKTKPATKGTELGIHDDPEFEKTLLELDEDFLLENVNALDKTIEAALKENKGKSPKQTSIKKKRKLSEVENEEDFEKDRTEKKRHSAMLYQKYLNRSGPAHHGEKEYPKGKPECLKNLCFLRTGVLDSLDNVEFENLINEHGGRVVHGVSKKVNYLVVGEDAGPSKLKKAAEYNIQTINEDELLDLILAKSGMKPKYVAGEGTSSETSDLKEPKLEDFKIKQTEEVKSETIKQKDIKEKISPREPPKSKKDKSSNIDNKISPKEGSSSLSIKKSIKSETNKPPKANNKIISKKEILNVKLNDEKPVLETGDIQSWTEKYKPINMKSIIGQQGNRSNMQKLMVWLQNWYKNHGGKTKAKLPRPGFKSDDGAPFKCALLSGPPGVGKTTTATLVAKELGFDIVEFNASDTRSKKLLQSEVSQLLSTTSLAGFFKEGSAPTKKHVLLMDEVDGMAGNEDRGGVQELIILIKNSGVPVICMCNDRNHPKIRSLSNYCFDLRFTKPRLEQIRGAMMSICFKEKLQISPEALSEIILGTGNDIRQTLNHLSMWSAGNQENFSLDEVKKEAKVAKKDVVMGPWDVIRKVFNEDDQKSMSIADKFRLFFYDYSIAPLFVQQNYLHVVPHFPKNQTLERLAKTADSISTGDLIDKRIRSGNNWSLLETQALFASVLPGHYLRGHFSAQINFPDWLGKNSRRNKFHRLLTELQAHTRTSVSGGRTDMNLDYIYHLRDCIVRPLVNEGANGVRKSVEVMDSYNLLREDFDSMLELTQWPHSDDPMKMVTSQVKAAFTRTYNKEVILPYSTHSTVKKTVREENDEDEELSEKDDDDDVAKDAMITAKKPSKQSGVKKGSNVEKKPAGKGRGKKTK